VEHPGLQQECQPSLAEGSQPLAHLLLLVLLVLRLPLAVVAVVLWVLLLPQLYGPLRHH
jgi:hypothetical protein